MPANMWRNMHSFYNLIGTKCECGELHFPEMQVCRKCGSTKMEPHPFKGKGSILTFTVIRQQFNDENESEKLLARNPYLIAIVQLEEGPMITTQITDAEIDSIKIGSTVRAVFRKISEDGEDGLIKYGYKFILADEKDF